MKNRLLFIVSYVLLAIVLPVLLVIIVRVATPDIGKGLSEFPNETFVPVKVWAVETNNLNGTDYFELRIENPESEVFFHRDPDPGPIEILKPQLSADGLIRIHYDSTREGNVLLQIESLASGSPELVLSFEDVVAEYSIRRTVVYVVAAIWFALANSLAFGLWKVGSAP